jgi:hypothetical protein
VAGIAAFRRGETSIFNPSASLIRQWITDATFVWLVSSDILDEYKRCWRACVLLVLQSVALLI